MDFYNTGINKIYNTGFDRILLNDPLNFILNKWNYSKLKFNNSLAKSGRAIINSYNEYSPLWRPGRYLYKYSFFCKFSENYQIHFKGFHLASQLFALTILIKTFYFDFQLPGLI